MKFHPASVALVVVLLLCVACSKPLMVTHWTAKDAAVLKKKGYGWPAHKWYSRVVCFDDNCRRKAAWVKNQRNNRFKGFKDGGKLPPRPPVQNQSENDSIVVANKQPVESKPKVVESAPLVVETVQAPAIDSLIVLNEVLFEVNSYHLRPELYPQLDSIATLLVRNPNTRIEISGHTDSTGKESHNLKLSENRADAVAEYLVDRGVKPDRVSFNGYGSSRPVDTNATEQGRRKNRRVEIRISSR